MPRSLRRQVPQQHLSTPIAPEETDSETELHEGDTQDLGADDGETEDMGDEMVVPEGEEEFDEDDALASPHQINTPLLNLDPPPSYLREISTLASWTVSSSKPGCSIPQLRHPSTALFWQSDGPQPHYLNIHFFKLVRIVGLRLYLDFEQDESYTPTRIIFLAGSGMNDLQEWGEMKLESPRGWVWADFSGVGDADSDSEDDSEDEEEPQPTMPGPPPPMAVNGTPGNAEQSSDSENNAPRLRFAHPQPPTQEQLHQQRQQQPAPLTDDAMQVDPRNNQTTPHAYIINTPEDITHSLRRPRPRQPFTALSPTNTPNNGGPHAHNSSRRRRPKMPVLRAHLVQIKILENHQNGKDTHLRGLQIFARNDEELSRAEPSSRQTRSADIKALMGEDVRYKSGSGSRSGPAGSGTAAGVGIGTGAGAARARVPGRAQRWDLGLGSRSSWDVEPSIR